MRVLLDTNVLSEPTRVNPDIRVLEWLNELDESQTFISAISLAEIRRGIVILEESRKRTTLAAWFDHELVPRFAERILPVDQSVAIAWGDFMGEAKRRGLGLKPMDGLLAATATVHDLTLATRNTRDFEQLGVMLVDPWSVG